MSTSKLRAWWAYKQGLDGRLKGSAAADVLAQTGWARSVGGVGPYFTLYSRAGISREVADRLVEEVAICELPSARGCTYVLPASDFALGLAAGEPFRANEMKTAAKLGVTDQEIDKLCSAVVEALGKGVLAPDEIRTATGDASRSLGEEGKKKGLTTTLPVALGKLQALGEIRRVSVEGRLDRQRYKYALWRPNPRAAFSMSREEINVELARRFFSWIGPVSLVDFQTFGALGVGASKAAVEPLGLVPVEPGSSMLMLQADKDAYEAFVPPTDPRYVLTSSLDGIGLLQKDVSALIDPADAGREVYVEGKFETAGVLKWMPAHAILDRGRLVGLWEFDSEAGEIVSYSFVPRSAALQEAIADMETYVRDQLGDARSFSLDSPKSRAPLLAALRRFRAGETA